MTRSTRTTLRHSRASWVGATVIAGAHRFLMSSRCMCPPTSHLQESLCNTSKISQGHPPEINPPPCLVATGLWLQVPNLARETAIGVDRVVAPPILVIISSEYILLNTLNLVHRCLSVSNRMCPNHKSRTGVSLVLNENVFGVSVPLIYDIHLTDIFYR
jgi:hypothetical protein